MKRGMMAAGAMLLSVAAPAQKNVPDLLQVTGNQYEQIFQGDPETYELGLAIFAKRLGEQSAAAPTHFICWPPGSTYMQGGKVVEAFLRDHPQYLNFTMHDLTATALMQAFPCP